MLEKVRVLITFVIEPHLIRRIEDVDPRVEVLYEPELLGSPRYACDQHGTPIQHTPEQEERWSRLLSRAEIILGYVLNTDVGELSRSAPRLRWVQSPSAGVGQ